MNNVLNIITPFKSENTISLEKTINSLAYQEFNHINHIIVCDISCKKIVDNYFRKISSNKSFFYDYLILKVNEKGIYNAINIGLSELEDNSLYLVLGAGDEMHLRKSYDFNYQNDFFLIPYINTHAPKKLFTKIRNIYSGIPYCHNAIVFKKNKIRYNKSLKISADYLYFIDYLKSKETKREFKKTLINEFKVLVETTSGISSSNKILKNLENLKVIFYRYSFKGVVFYMFFASISFSKFILKKISLIS